MKTYLIGYDLMKQGQDYDVLIEEIKKIGNWWHCLDSTWIIKTNLDSEQIRNRLIPKIDNNDTYTYVHKDLTKLRSEHIVIHKMGLFRTPLWNRMNILFVRLE
jgi:hypothetical protein